MARERERTRVVSDPPADPTNPTGDPDAGFDAGPGGQETHSDPEPPPGDTEAAHLTVDAALKEANEAKRRRDRAWKTYQGYDTAYKEALKRFKEAAARAE